MAATQDPSVSGQPLTSTEAAWQSSRAAWQSIKHGERSAKIAKTSALPPTSSEATRRSGEAARQSTKRGEEIAEVPQTLTLAPTSGEAAWQSSKIAWQSIGEKEKTAKIVRTRKQIATSSTKTLSRSSPPIVAPAPQDDSPQPIPRATTIGDEVTKHAVVLSDDETPQTCPVTRVRVQTLRLICKQPLAATADDDNEPATAQRRQLSTPQQSQPQNPSPDSKIQKIPTKDPAHQYYSRQASGGWKILNARDAAIEIQREDREKAWKERKRTAGGKLEEAADSYRDKEPNHRGSGLQNPSPRRSFTRPPTSDGITSKNPPVKRRYADYEGLISCKLSDKLWKNWENKHLLRSHAAGSSFAQISASRQFSNGLVIRGEKECQERYEVLQEWQPFQDEELLRAGESGANEDFAQICSVNFSRGLVKRSAEQCKERFEFLKNSEFEGFD